MMSSSTVSLYLSTVLMFTLVPSSYQLKCYSCSENSLNNVPPIPGLPGVPTVSCGDFQDNVLANCPFSQTCNKFVVTLSSGSTDTKASVHTCGASPDYCSRIGSKRLGVDCYSCDKDKCNSASSLAAITSLLLLPIIFWKLY